MPRSTRTHSCLLLATLLAAPAVALEPGSWNAALRLRIEAVDSDASARSALAPTARLRLGWQQPLGSGFEARLEGEALTGLGQRYNSGANGRTQFPLVPDARTAEVNQATLGWRAGRSAVLLGRQRIELDNQRFVGSVGWRQNQQTFDALGLEHTFGSDTLLRGYWLDRVHRINGNGARDPLQRERALDGQLFNLARPLGGGLLVGYAYRVEDRDVVTASSRSYGLRWSGSHAGSGFGWSLEAARQQEHAGNPLDFSHGYRLAEATLARAGIAWKAGFERLGGNGRHAFQTPLATLHAFNGWADQFLVTPASGLEDLYLGAAGKFGRGAWTDKFNWTVVGHEFRADRGDRRYGREWDAAVGVTLPRGWQAQLKFADYRAAGFGSDTRKLWLQFEWTR